MNTEHGSFSKTSTDVHFVERLVEKALLAVEGI